MTFALWLPIKSGIFGYNQVLKTGVALYQQG